MKILIIVTLIVEALVGLLLLLKPDLVPQLSGTSGMGLAMARIYGAAAITIAILCFWTLKNLGDKNVVNVFLHVIIDFQILLVIASAMSFVKGESSDPGPIMLHGLFLIAYLYFYIQRKKSK